MQKYHTWLKRLFIAFFLLVGLFAAGEIIVRGTGITRSFLLIELAPAIGVWVSLILLIYYGLLLSSSQDQAKAARASFAPDLNISLRDNERGLLSQSTRVRLAIVNRGQGVAKDISVKIKIDDKRPQYICEINQSLRPGQMFKKDKNRDRDSFEIRPKFKYGTKSGFYTGSLSNYLTYLQNNSSDTFNITLVVQWSDILEDEYYSRTMSYSVPSPESENIQPAEEPRQIDYAGEVSARPAGRVSRLKWFIIRRIRGFVQENDGIDYKLVYKENIDLRPVDE